MAAASGSAARARNGAGKIKIIIMAGSVFWRQK